MRIYFPQYYTQKSRFLSYTVIAETLKNKGHDVSDVRHNADIAIFSMCDVTEYPQLIKMRAETEGIPLIVGGAFAFNFLSAKIYADAVWIGECFDFADCQSYEDIVQSKYSYVGGSELPVASQRIEWEIVSVAQIAPKKCYYWGGVGCKNKCAFCFTSWTHRHQVNSKQRIEAAKRVATKNKCHIMISSNEYDNDISAKTFDMMLKDYVKTPIKGSKMIRCGIEFPNETTRKAVGKPITDQEIYEAFQKSKLENGSLRLFHIAGYNSIDDWEEYIAKISMMLRKVNPPRMIHFMFNNLQYQNFTPLYRERRNINPANYISVKTTRRWYDELRRSCSHVLVGAPSPFQHVACRMGIELARDKKALDFWCKMLSNPKKMTLRSAHKALIDSKTLECPAYQVRLSDGQIIRQENWD